MTNQLVVSSNLNMGSNAITNCVNLIDYTSVQSLANKILDGACNTITATNIYSGSNKVTFFGTGVSGQALTSTGSTSAAWQTVTTTGLSGIVQVLQGGTSLTSIATAGILIGNGTAAPTVQTLSGGAVIDSNSVQSMANKILNGACNSITATNIYSGTNAVTLFGTGVSGQVLTSTGSSSAAWQIISAAFTGVLPVIQGGTGLSTFGGVLIGNGTVTPTVQTISGGVIDSNSVQSLANKILDGACNSITATNIYSGGSNVVTFTGTGSSGLALTSTGSSGATWLPLGGTFIPVIQGGTSLSAIATNGILIGNGTNTPTVQTLSGSVVDLNSVQSLTNKIITATSNVVRATQFATSGSDVIINSTAPTAIGSQTLITNSTTSATWQNAPSVATSSNQELTMFFGSSPTSHMTGSSLVVTANATSFSIGDPTASIIAGDINQTVLGFGGALSQGNNNTVIGFNARATNSDQNTAVGANAVAGATTGGGGSSALGYAASAFGASGTNMIAIGAITSASASGAICIGVSSSAAATNLTVIGNSITSTTANTIILGNTTQTAMFSAGMVYFRNTITGSYAGTYADYIIAVTSGLPLTVTLPNATTPETFLIKDETGTASGGNAITITPVSGTINGTSSISITSAYGVARVYATGSGNYFTW